MASLNKNTLESDDEDDLELLRLAALKSLKPKSAAETHSKPSGNGQCKPLPTFNNKLSTFGAAQTTRHHNRGFRSNPGGRLGRNGINSRRTNTNLISIQTIDPDEPKQVKDTPVDIPKLILPQDRYHKQLAAENTPKENSGNKFDRYDNSDESESDSDDLAIKTSRRERKSSVERLMEEIDNEINLLDGKQATEEEEIEESKVEEEEITPTQSDTLIISETDPDLVQIDEPTSPFKEESIEEPPPIKSRSLSPFSEKSPPQKRKSKSKSRSRSPYLAQYKSPYRSPRSRSPPRKRYSPNYPRVLSPLTLNTEVLNTMTMAPLSPRSAAFVLENRQILARRKMSPPRRTLSRESSCRSLSPKSRRRSRSPLKRSISPRRRSLSPRNNHRSKKRSSSPVNKIHKRLGSRPNSRNVSPYIERKPELGKRKRNSRSISLSLSPSPDRNYHKRPLNETTGHLEHRNRKEKRKESPKPEKSIEDPILEARRRKFESPVQINNGIIKLKPNKLGDEIKDTKETSKEGMEKTVSSEENLDETEEIIVLNPSLDDLWSDEESDDENEGRFKSKPSSEKRNIPIPSFRKLAERPIPNSLLPKDDNDRRDIRCKRQRRRRSRTPLKSTNKELKKEPAKEKAKPVDNKVRTKPEEDTKKEKIALKSADILYPLQSDKNIKRKVKIQEVSATTDENKEGIEIVENETTTNKEDDAGDLRAELSRRRAQRLIKAGNLAESLPTRLLKTALREVVPKRSPVKQARVAKVGSKEGKLPIHMRLGSNPDGEESVTVRSERRNKRRISRRKKPVQV